MNERILVLGAGPAGGAAALGLQRLGYRVTVVCQPRPFRALEGVSSRVVQGLTGAGFQHALAAVVPPSPRQASWNGTFNDANTEHLIDRQALDAGILLDLKAAGIEVIEQRAVKVSHADGHWRVALAEGAVLEGAFLVEARGRMAPSAHLARLRGPETVSLLQYWQGPPAPRGSAAVSCEQGWVWMARAECGRRYLQLTLDVSSQSLPPKAELAAFCEQHFRALPEAAPFIDGAQPLADVQARTSTAILCQQPVGDNWIRVGDAAMAVDPLSGNGIFQALSSALQAPAVVHTLLRHPEQSALAQQFHRQRVAGLFHRFARIGRDFYAMEQRWTAHPFWQARCHWPDAEPLHQQVRFEQLSVAQMPVVHNNRIEAQAVVVSPDQPLGIWHLGGIALAPIVTAVQARTPQQSLVECLAGLSLSQEQQTFVLQWLASLGLNAD